jgi:hypothetical protein
MKKRGNKKKCHLFEKKEFNLIQKRYGIKNTLDELKNTDNIRASNAFVKHLLSTSLQDKHKDSKKYGERIIVRQKSTTYLFLD